jgi:hypothetical protein
MIIYQNDREVITDNILAEDLFIKWGYDVKQERIEVKNLNDVTSELSMWGIPWKWKS